MSENSRQSQSHIDSIVRQEEEALERRSSSERLADAVGGFAGSLFFRCASPSARDRVAAGETLCEAGMAVAEQVGREAELRPNEEPQVNVAGIEETVTDKGYHSGAVVKRMKAYGVRSYIPEKKQKGRRNWAGKPAEQQAVYANRRRVRGLSLIHISEPTDGLLSRMPSSA